MSMGARPLPHRVHWLHRWVVRLLVGLVAAAGIVVGIDRAFFSGQAEYSWPPEPCVVDGIDARCGTFVVPENRTKPNGRTIGLNVVVLPAFSKPARNDAVTYLEGGPGGTATEEAAIRSQQLVTLNLYRDILLVDQRGTGRSTRHDPDVTQYGTRMAMDDLDAVRAALGYRKLDVIGSSYGATAAQVYLNLHPSSVRTLILMPLMLLFWVGIVLGIVWIAHGGLESRREGRRETPTEILERRFAEGAISPEEYNERREIISHTSR